MRRRFGQLAVLLLVALALSPLNQREAQASCAAPILAIAGQDVARPGVSPGAAITVEGRGFVDGCDDQGGGTVGGCHASEEAPEVERPLADIDLVIRQRGREWPLGTADAGSVDDGRFGRISWPATMPADLGAGRATISALGYDLVVRVRR